MGIPFYFASLVKSHRGITSSVRERLDVDVLGIDFNCLIHRYLNEANPIDSVVNSFEHILDTICRPKKLLIAMDGVVPYAKIVQQRYRRMRKPEETSAIFDRNQISPGTPYMKELEAALASRFPYAVISSTAEPGEGEHKLFNMLKSMNSNERKSVCIYGLDADLILICLQGSHLATQMHLLRESNEFNDPRLEHAEFGLLSIHALTKELPIPIEQYIALGILCFGNDFMPSLGMFSLREGGYQRALDIYKESGNPDLLTFEGRDIFLETAEKQEFDIIKERIGLRRRPEEKAIFGKNGDMFEKQYRLHVLDGVQDMKPVVDAYWKTFHWTLHYFRTNEPLNWSWVYPYPEAPLIRSILEYDETSPPARNKRTFGIPKQLAFILPSTSLKNAKRKQEYPDEIYTETRHPWMKRHDWETKPRISLPWNPKFNLTEIVPL